MAPADNPAAAEPATTSATDLRRGLMDTSLSLGHLPRLSQWCPSSQAWAFSTAESRIKQTSKQGPSFANAHSPPRPTCAAAVRTASDRTRILVGHHGRREAPGGARMKRERRGFDPRTTPHRDSLLGG